MSRSTLCLLVPVSLALGLTARGDGEAPRQQTTSFETLMEEKGLKRFGLSYILKDTEERDRQVDEFNGTLAKLAEQYEPLASLKSRLESDLKIAEDAYRRPYRSSTSNDKPEDEERKRAEHEASTRRARDSAQFALDAFNRNYGETLRLYEAEKRRIQKEIRSFVARTMMIYDKLSQNPAVKEAFRTRNRELRPKVVLGPVRSQEEYWAIIRRDDIALLGERGVLLDPKLKRFVLAAEKRVLEIAAQVENSLKGLSAAETRARGRGDSPRQKVQKQRDAVAAALARAAPNAKPPLTVRLNILDGQLKKLPPEDLELDAEAQRRSAEVFALRKAFLGELDDLRNAIAEAPRRREILEADAEVRATLEEVLNKKGAIKIIPPPQFSQGISTLTRLEKTIRIERIPIGVGKEGELTVNVVLNGGQPVAMAIDPAARASRTLLPAALAEAVGAAPSPGAPEIAVTPPGGEVIQARRARINSVRIGGFTVEGTNGYVILGAPPVLAGPILGADILNHFAWDVPFGGKELILTEVIPARTEAQAKGAQSKAKGQ